MSYFVLKVGISALLIAGISELAKRNSLMGALLASIPLVSVLAMIWLFAETRDAEKVAALAGDIFWLVLPSLALFLALPVMLRHGWAFWWALPASLGLTVLAYAATLKLLGRPLT